MIPASGMVVLSALVALILPLSTIASYSVIIASGDEECYVIRAPSNQESIIDGNFDVLDDDLSIDVISARLESDEEVVWESHKSEGESIFEYHAKNGGVYRYCLENGKHQKPDGLDRHVGWALRLRKPPRMLDNDMEGPDQQRASELVEMAADLSNEWVSLLDHYSYLESREYAHREMTQQILTRVVRWTVVEGLVLLLIAGGQVIYLRKFFERRRYL